MKKWKSALIMLSIIILISTFLFFVPLDGIIKYLPILNSFYKNTTLEITTPNGKSTVKIDGKEYGETPTNIQNLIAGEYEIELSRTSAVEGYYKPHIFNVVLTKNSTSRINMEIGPDDSLHGVVLYYTQDLIGTKGKGKITLTTNSENAKIYTDDDFLKSAPVSNLDMNVGEYKMTVTAENYQDLKFQIVVREGYILNIKGYLLPNPVNFEIVPSDG
ncbi:MAG: WD40-domain containing protein [candidate division WS6 bacterium GW2011_GWC1_33_20]|uniref:WD40-domain containing protein n=2 Tax=Candidatus Dojkabacteria TaxID=74243 RepID=A0A0F9ZJL3_9BACT|nr:MAG: WD40-domain containing protein [candidate division WS6 bacterium GW2011_GWE2_33_157]KKP44284.1 MAG: WD40-domain containing protein [candidate division WS6 bacterium GW2011_GWC1_33_20]KKP45851.1 MAG: WD40-domain containing protein [candidate division WS6 bacterium GW2011_GWF1_33_233]KKP54615.1 MAG: WD40-domain containing protein [candidate division WS6 bacterium GW2011_WS6_33_547]OGC35877.1 MAG: hypothetical protein A2369_02210 [candidate division WS6 bacterium RIFOXYB1_FULL_33_15]HBB64